MDGNTEATVYFTRLGDLLHVYPLNVKGPEVSAIRDLYCAVSRSTADGQQSADSPGTLYGNYLRASAADAQRWRAATEEILRVVETVQEEERQASLHLYPPYHPITHHIAWKIRHHRRNRRLSAEYDTTMERLRARVLTAYRTFRERSGDLTARIEAGRRLLEEQGRPVEWQERQWERRPRADSVTAARYSRVWAYRVDDLELGQRLFQICLQTVGTLPSGGDHQSGLTPHDVQLALAEQRSRHPYTVVSWEPETRLALEEWHSSGRAELAWRELTGVLVEPYPPHLG